MTNAKITGKELTSAQAAELRAVATDPSGYMEADTGDYRSRVELKTLGFVETDGPAEWFPTAAGEAWLKARE